MWDVTTPARASPSPCPLPYNRRHPMHVVDPVPVVRSVESSRFPHCNEIELHVEYYDGRSEVTRIIFDDPEAYYTEIRDFIVVKN